MAPDVDRSPSPAGSAVACGAAAAADGPMGSRSCGVGALEKPPPIRSGAVVAEQPVGNRPAGSPAPRGDEHGIL